MNTKKQQKQKQMPKPKSRPAALVNIPHLSPCARAYLRVLSDPWTMPSELPCIPDVITMPSRKFQTKARGVFKVGNGGVGWVSCSPFTMAVTGLSIDGNRVDSPLVFTTGTDYTFSSYSWAAASGNISTPGVAIGNSNSPIAYGTVAADGVQIRLVGGGLRVKYTGTELNRGGRLILYRSRSNAPVAQGTNATGLLTDPTAYVNDVVRGWQGVTYVPDSSFYLSYTNFGTFLPSQGTGESSARRSLLAYVDGAVPGTSFEFEAVSYYELIGPSQEATPSHADPVGFGAILSALPERVTSLGQQTYSTMEKGALRALENTTSGLFQVAAGAVATSLSSLMASRMSPMALAGPGPVITEL